MVEIEIIIHYHSCIYCLVTAIEVLVSHSTKTTRAGQYIDKTYNLTERSNFYFTCLCSRHLNISLDNKINNIINKIQSNCYNRSYFKNCLSLKKARIKCEKEVKALKSYHTSVVSERIRILSPMDYRLPFNPAAWLKDSKPQWYKNDIKMFIVYQVNMVNCMWAIHQDV